jgi:hypothetical protein
LPTEPLDLIGQRNAGGTTGQLDLESIPVDFRGGEAADKQFRAIIVAGGTENHGGPMFGLFVSRLGIDVDTNYIATIWDIGSRH